MKSSQMSVLVAAAITIGIALPTSQVPLSAFVLAAKRGVPQHHWNFGNMPPQPQVGDRSLQQIIAYVRELQQANGIY